MMMCAPRKEGEPWAAYAFRYTVELVEEHARSVLAVVGIAAAIWLYIDFRDTVLDIRALINTQTESYRAISLELREMNIRISNLEHEKRYGDKTAN